MRTLGLIFLWITSIPGWFILFIVIQTSIEEILPQHEWKLTPKFEKERISEGNGWIWEKEYSTLYIDKIKIFEFTEREKSFLNIFFPKQKKLVFEFEKTDDLNNFFSALSNNKTTHSFCYVQPGKKHFRVEVYNPNQDLINFIEIHFCYKKGQFISIISERKSIVRGAFYESFPLAEFLVNIGFQPELAY